MMTGISASVPVLTSIATFPGLAGKPEPADGRARDGIGRHRAGIEGDAILSRHGREIAAAEIVDQSFRRGHLAPLDPVGIADPSQRLFLRAMQEHRTDLAAMPAHD